MIRAREKYIKKTENIGNKLRNFFYGEFYPAIIALVAVLFFTADLSVLGLYVFVFFAVIALLLYQDLTPFMPLPMMVLMLFRDLNVFLEFTTYVPLSFAFVALVLHFIIYPVKLKKGKLYKPLIFLSVALLLSGLFAPDLFSYYHMGLVSRSATGPLMLFVYYLFINCINPPKDFDLTKYICYILTLIGLICFLELEVHAYFLDLKIDGVKSYFVGWNNVNGVAALLLVTIPACFYLLVKTGKVILCSIAIVCLYRAVYLTGSDGCLGIALVSLPLFVFLAYKKSSKKTRLIISYTSYTVALIVICALFLSVNKTGAIPIIDQIKENIFYDNGRTEIYIDAWNTFLKYPIFGIGIGYCPEGTELQTNVILAYNYHSTFFHVIATMGLVGLAAFIYYFVNRYRILMQNVSAFNLFAFLSFTLMEVYGFIDTCEFNIIPLMLIVTIMIIVVEVANANRKETLPLKNKTY